MDLRDKSKLVKKLSIHHGFAFNPGDGEVKLGIGKVLVDVGLGGSDNLDDLLDPGLIALQTSRIGRNED